MCACVHVGLLRATSMLQAWQNLEGGIGTLGKDKKVQ